MRIYIFILISTICINFCSGIDIFAEDSLALQEQDESGRQMSGVGWLCGVNTKTGDVCINDFQYHLLENTKFSSEDGGVLSVKSFKDEVLVSFEANEKGELILLALFKDIEGEYSNKNSNVDSDVNDKEIDNQSKRKKAKIVKENGVWKN